MQTSCLTEHFFDRALERAKYLDDYLQREGRVVGPLHGLPVSIKDSFCLEGIQSTVGYVSFLNNPPASSNSALVDLLLDLGAVLYVKTNIPQTMMVRILLPYLGTNIISDTYIDGRLGEQHFRPNAEPAQYEVDSRWIERW